MTIEGDASTCARLRIPLDDQVLKSLRGIGARPRSSGHRKKIGPAYGICSARHGRGNHVASRTWRDDGSGGLLVMLIFLLFFALARLVAILPMAQRLQLLEMDRNSLEPVQPKRPRLRPEAQAYRELSRQVLT